MKILALLLLSAPLFHSGAEDAYYEVPLGELELEGELPSYPDSVPWPVGQRYEAMWPRAVIEGEGEVFYDLRQQVDNSWQRPSFLDRGALHVHTSSVREVRGLLFVPDATWEGMLSIPFRIPAEASGDHESSFLQAKVRHYDRLMQLGFAGTAWFRHERGEARAGIPGGVVPDPVVRWSGGRRRGELQDSYALFSGGRAVSENLQLDRLQPESIDEQAEVALDSMRGIEVREMDWEELIAGTEPGTDTLAALVPADQHVVLFPSFQALVQVVDAAAEIGAPLVGTFEESSRDAGTRERYEEQLGLPLDTFARMLGSTLVRSVAITGSDAYLRTGSDVAVLFQPAEGGPDPLLAAVRARQEAAAAGLPPVEGLVAGTSFRGYVSPGRRICAYSARIGDAVVVTNSLHQLERVARTAAGKEPALGQAPEFHFFRSRYELGAAGESALIVLPDAAIRRWCGPRWRIAASRRTRAMAVLADLHARYATELGGGADMDVVVKDERFRGMGELRLTPDGVVSEVYGTLGFQTPIAELELEQVGEREARLYRIWRDGYEANWSRFFDPIALRIDVRPDGLDLDLTVMPLILGTDYDEMRGLVGEAKLGPGSGDPHAETVFRFTMALDRDAELLRDLGETMGGMLGQAIDPLGWLGGSFTVYVDRDPFLEELLAAEDSEEALENLQVDPNSMPLVIHIEVSSGLKLAGFLATVRGFLEQTAPGMLRWDDVTVGELRYVRLTSAGLTGDDVSLLYATTPNAFLLSLHEEALLRALGRAATRSQDDEASEAPPWVGESLHVDLDREGLEAIQLLEGDDLRNELQRRSWENLFVLNEWRARFPNADPVTLHAQVFGERLVCPGGGSYVWNADWRTMESTVFGHPGEHAAGVGLPPALGRLRSLGLGLTFENDGLRSRVRLDQE